LRSDVNCDGRVDQEDINAVLAARGADARSVLNPCTTKKSTEGLDEDRPREPKAGFRRAPGR
jgi:hypothetical protein